MTIAEMHRAVRTQFEQVASHTLDNFLPQEMDIYLNRATRTYVDSQRTVLLSAREQVQSREANENLRTLIVNALIANDRTTSIESLPAYGEDAKKVDLTSLTDKYSYYLKARLKTFGKDFYTLRKVSLEEWHEHAPTKHNVPIFRRPVVYESGTDLWVILPDDAGDISEFHLTYLKNPAVLDSEIQKTYRVQKDDNPSDAEIYINEGTYPVTWDTDLSTTLNNFIAAHAEDLWANQRVRVEFQAPDELVFTTSAFFVTLDSFDRMDGQVDFFPDVTGERTDSDLPLHTHQDIIDLTVNLLRRDLPQPASDE